MKAKALQFGKAMSAALFVLLLVVAGMKKSLAQPQGALNGVFTINDNGGKVCFSKGNLQCRPYSNGWKFANHQYDCIGTENSQINQAYTGYIDLFGWGTSGYSHGAICYQPWSTSMNDENYYAYGNSTANLFDRDGRADWGYRNINGVKWRTLKIEEWIYIITLRHTQSGLKYAKAKVNDVNGLILLPDDWKTSYYTLNYPNQYGVSFDVNVMTASQWNGLETFGAVFLPCAGRRGADHVYGVNALGQYWSSSCSEAPAFLGFDAEGVACNYNVRNNGRSVRLVCDIYTVEVSSNPDVGGTVTGGNTYSQGQSCTVCATSGLGYRFVNWTEEETVISNASNYSFTVVSNRNLVANFSFDDCEINATINPTSGGTVTGAGIYNYGTIATLVATPNTGYSFVNWTKDGQEVSTDLNYSFTVTEAAAFVANFEINSYEIIVEVVPTIGGTAEGTGTYNHFETCTLSALANTSYTFINWTCNGQEVSTEPSYSFSVTEDMVFIANFEEIQADYFNISVSSSPSEGGSFVGVGNYLSGQLCTIIATPNAGYTFGSWTENGETVSTDATYSFIVSGDRTLVANFAPEGNYWTPENTGNYSMMMALTGVIEIDGVEQFSDQLEVGAFCNGVCRGSQMATEFYLTNRYLVMLSIHGEIGDELTFKLYDHGLAQELNLASPDAVTFTIDGYGTPIEPYALNFISSYEIVAATDPEGAGTIAGTGSYVAGSSCTLVAEANDGYQFVNWTLDGVEVSTNANFDFAVTQSATYVAHFHSVQTQTLAQGWNWWSTYIGQNGSDGLTMLENSLGSNGVRIQSKNNGYVDQFEYNGTSYWYGTLNALTNEQMYMVRTHTPCDATMTGQANALADHPISINNGWNWIGFPGSESVSVDNALSGFAPEANDQIKSKNNGYSTYVVYGSNALWYGTLNTLEPGQGYMYNSNSGETKTLVYQDGRGETRANVTTEGNVFQPNEADYAHNMTITAIVELDGDELRSDSYELAVFAGNECRGSVKLMYAELLDRYVAFLLVAGEAEENLRFVLTDGRNARWSDDEMMFAIDSVVGTPIEPAIIHFGTLGVDENDGDNIIVYPNPFKNVFNIEGVCLRKVEIVNAYGQVIFTKEIAGDHLQIDLGNRSAGVYMLRVVTEKGIKTQQIIKNN